MDVEVDSTLLRKIGRRSIKSRNRTLDGRTHSNALSAVAVTKDIFEQRGIGLDRLPPASPELLPLNEAAEAARASRVQQDIGHVAPGVVQYTTDLLFRGLWLRPAPRERSLVTVSALMASGQAAQITYRLDRAMDNGLTKVEASEVLAHLALYAGWPNVFSALPVVKAVFEKRAELAGQEKQKCPM
jgi:4-carboxymuconolactone decarboxylase